MEIDRDAIAGAWKGRISGCQLGKPVEMLSMREGFGALQAFLTEADALPLRDYVPYRDGHGLFEPSCRGRMTRSEPDDDVNYSVLALNLLEQHGRDLTTEDVARAWFQILPYGMVFTAEAAAYQTLVARAVPFFAQGRAVGFDLAACAENPYNDWIGAQIRADVYGWVCPGDPVEAARLAAVDAELSHRGAGVDGARFVAACGAAIPAADSLADAVDRATAELADGSEAAGAVAFARSLVGREDAVAALHAEYADLSPVHTLNNLALVVWALLSHPDDFGAAIGDAVAAGWDTDCNGATVGGLWGLTGQGVPSGWTDPWHETVAVSLAGHGELPLAELVDRTVAVAEALRA